MAGPPLPRPFLLVSLASDKVCTLFFFLFLFSSILPLSMQRRLSAFLVLVQLIIGPTSLTLASVPIILLLRYSKNTTTINTTTASLGCWSHAPYVALYAETRLPYEYLGEVSRRLAWNKSHLALAVGSRSLLFAFFRPLALGQRYWSSETKLSGKSNFPEVMLKMTRQAFSGKPYVSWDRHSHQCRGRIAMSLPWAGGKQTISTSTYTPIHSRTCLSMESPKFSSRVRRCSLYTRPEFSLCATLRGDRLAAFPFASSPHTKRGRRQVKIGRAYYLDLRLPAWLECNRMLPDIVSYPHSFCHHADSARSDKSWHDAQWLRTIFHVGATSPHRL